MGDAQNTSDIAMAAINGIPSTTPIIPFHFPEESLHLDENPGSVPDEESCTSGSNASHNNKKQHSKV